MQEETDMNLQSHLQLAFHFPEGLHHGSTLMCLKIKELELEMT